MLISNRVEGLTQSIKYIIQLTLENSFTITSECLNGVVYNLNILPIVMSNPTGKIAVVLGARGGTGSQIVARLAELDEGLVSEIRAVVRDATQVDKLSDYGPKLSQEMFKSRLEKVCLMNGDVTKAETLKEALKDANWVFNASSGKGSEAEVAAVDRDAIQTTLDVINEVASNSIERYVLVSSQLVHPSNRWNPVRIMINSLATGIRSRKGIMDYKWEGEQILRQQSEVPYTIVRPGRLTDGTLYQTGNMVVGQTNSSLPGVGSTRADIAALCIAAAMSSKTKNTTFEANTKAEANLTNIKPISEELFEGLDPNFLTSSK